MGDAHRREKRLGQRRQHPVSAAGRQAGLHRRVVERFSNIGLLFEQADTNLTISKLAAISAVLAVMGTRPGDPGGDPPALIPLAALLLGSLPLVWLLLRNAG